MSDNWEDNKPLNISFSEFKGYINDIYEKIDKLKHVDISTSIKNSFKYKIEQTAKGARITVHGDNLNETLTEYKQMRQMLEADGIKVAPEE